MVPDHRRADAGRNGSRPPLGGGDSACQQPDGDDTSSPNGAEFDFRRNIRADKELLRDPHDPACERRLADATATQGFGGVVMTGFALARACAGSRKFRMGLLVTGEGE
jgi:hypothetical protein